MSYKKEPRYVVYFVISTELLAFRLPFQSVGFAARNI